MARALVGLKVKIGLKENGHAKYPDFNSLQVVKASGMDWSQYIDVQGLGWAYDKTSGHKEETDDSPLGQQWGMLLVPATFAEQAMEAFPDEVTELDESEIEDFHENKAHVNDPDELIDENVLTAIQLKQSLGKTLTDAQEKALDPDDDTPGIRTNKDKAYSTFKAKRGFTVTQIRKEAKAATGSGKTAEE